MKKRSGLLVSLLFVLSCATICHSAQAADNGPIIVTEIPDYDRATCERLWWTIIAIEEKIEAGCSIGTTAKQCRAYMTTLRAQSARLQDIYTDGGCYRWVD